MSLKKRIIRLASHIENILDHARYDVRKRWQRTADLHIVAFRTYGTPSRFYVKGRVLKNKNLHTSAPGDSTWKNVVNMYKRFETDEVRGAALRLTLHGNDYRILTDDEGYFVYDIQTAEPIVSDQLWYEVGITLETAPYKFSGEIRSLAHVLVPPSEAEYGIISDIDDTIIKTTATSLLAMVRNTFFHNAHSRLPFAGVSDFYGALQKGMNGKKSNPFFYVSSSPWNLYDLLIEFLDINNIPQGPLLLRDFGLDPDKKSADHMGHKFHEIENIFNTYPQLKFVLIGDSGQDDPRIYQEVVRKFPQRVLAIYIRDVQLADRQKIAIHVAQSLQGEKVEMVVVDNTVQAAEHAASRGLIFFETIPQVVAGKEQDTGESPGKKDI